CGRGEERVEVIRCLAARRHERLESVAGRDEADGAPVVHDGEAHNEHGKGRLLGGGFWSEQSESAHIRTKVLICMPNSTTSGAMGANLWIAEPHQVLILLHASLNFWTID